MPLEKRLKGKRVALFAEDLYEDLELWYPLLRLQEEGAEVVVVGPGPAAEHHGKYGYPVAVDQAIAAAGLHARVRDGIRCEPGEAGVISFQLPAVIKRRCASPLWLYLGKFF
jgi:hypothetical protein